MKTRHQVVFKNSNNLEHIPAESVDLIVTSPPYPMIEMWDSVLSAQDPAISEAFKKNKETAVTTQTVGLNYYRPSLKLKIYQRFTDMKNIHRQSFMRITCTVLCSVVFLFLTHTNVSAQGEGVEDISVSVPAESVENFVSKLLPYKIDLGKGFSGNFLVKSIDNIRIKEDKVYFSSYIHGENVAFRAKIGKQEAVLSFGNINLRNQWHIAYRHDAAKGVLYVKPHLVDQKTDKKSSQGDMLLTALFGGLSDIEYPVDLKDLSPIITEFLDKNLTIHVSVSKIQTSDNKFIIYIKPIPKIETIEKPGKK